MEKIMKKLMLITVLTMASNNAYASEKEYTMQVHGAVCASCAYGLEKKFKKIEGVEKFDIDLKSGQVFVCAKDSVNFTEDQLTKLFIESGYSYKGMEVKENCSDKLDDNK